MCTAVEAVMGDRLVRYTAGGAGCKQAQQCELMTGNRARSRPTSSCGCPWLLVCIPVTAVSP